MFRTADGSADVAIYALPNAHQPPEEFLRSHFALPESAIVYRRVTAKMVRFQDSEETKFGMRDATSHRPNWAASDSIIPVQKRARWDIPSTRISHSLSG